jgi:hypothetical protein
MTVADWELWACAHEMIRRHGADAAIQGAMRADELLSKGDYEGAATWQRIVNRINQLGSPASATRH